MENDEETFHFFFFGSYSLCLSVVSHPPLHPYPPPSTGRAVMGDASFDKALSSLSIPETSLNKESSSNQDHQRPRGVPTYHGHLLRGFVISRTIICISR